jgi:hypothetical protein
VVTEIPLDRIRLIDGVQQRTRLDETHVEELKDALADGAALPPARVFFDGTDYILSRGFHRFPAYKRAGFTAMPCEVFDGGRREAILDACGDNADHGLKRTNGDKRKAVTTLLSDPEWSGNSDRWIAELVKVSHPFVASVRTNMGQLETLPVGKKGKDGKRRRNRRGSGGKRNKRPTTVSGATSTKQEETGEAKETAEVGKRKEPIKVGQQPTITDVLDRINDAGTAIESYAATEVGREVDVPKAASLVKQLKAVVAGGGRRHVIAADVSMPPNLDTQECRNALDEWLVYKRGRNNAYKDAKGVEKLLRQWTEAKPAEFIAAVEYSQGQRYQALVPEKPSGNGFAKAPRRIGPGERFDPTAELGSL